MDFQILDLKKTKLKGKKLVKATNLGKRKLKFKAKPHIL